MAFIVPGSIVADISGKVGDNIYSRNRGGLYVKQFTSPVQPNTSYQNTALGYFSDANGAWNGLSDTEYIEWANFTKNFIKSTFNGSQRQWTPKGLFIHGYVNRRFIGAFPNPLPVMPENMGFLSFEVDQPSGSVLNFTTFGGSTTVDYFVLFWSALPSLLTVRSINSIQQAFFSSWTYLADTPRDVSFEYLSRFGPSLATDSQRIFASVKVMHVVSGLTVGRGWNSAIGFSGAAPYNIGNDDIRTTSAAIGHVNALPVTTVLAGSIPGISLYFGASGGDAKVALYDDLAGAPNNLLIQSVSTPVTASGAWQLIPFPAPFAAAAATPYHIALTGQGGASFRIDPIPIIGVYKINSFFTFPDPFGTPTAAGNGISAFATVTP